MIGARARGVLLYSLFAALLVGGAVWWVTGAPELTEDPEVAGWRATVLAQIPETENRAAAGTVALTAGTRRTLEADLRGGSYLVSVTCAGPGRVRVSFSTGGEDTGRGLECGARPSPVAFRVALADQLRLAVRVDSSGPVVFRWLAQRLTDD